MVQTLQIRVVHAQQRRERIFRHDELTRAGLDHVFLLNVTTYVFHLYQPAMSVEAAHLREAFRDIFSFEKPLEGNDALAVLQWQQEVVLGSDVNWFELGGREVQLLEWKLHVCEGQLAERRLAHVEKRSE